MSRLTSCLFFFAAISSYAQDSSSTIYFYRTEKARGATYEITDGGNSIGKMSRGSVIVYQCSAGDHEFVATGQNPSSFRLNTEAGKEYFINCGITSDLAPRATFRESRVGEARMEIKEIDEVVASRFSTTQLTTSVDTVKALRHLFKRKRGWGIAFTVIGSLVIARNSFVLINNPITETPIGYGLTIEHDKRPSLVFGLVAGAVVTGIGVSRLPYWKQERLDAMLEDKAQGIPFPAKVITKLKPRDFVTQ